MKRNILATVSGAVVLFSVAVLPAFAATLSSGAGATVGRDVTSIGTTIRGSDTGTSNGSLGITVSGGTSSASQSSASVGVSGALTGDTDMTGSSTDMAGMTSGTLNLSRNTAAVTSYSDNGTPATDPSVVTTSDQLNTYAAATMHSDPNIQNVQLSNTAVSMNYNEKGNLFGFIPVAMNTQAEVDQNGNVMVNYPWYHFLVSANDANLKADIAASVQHTLSGSANGTTSATVTTSGTNNAATMNDQFSAQTQAELMTDLYSGFTNEVNGSASAGGSANQ